MEKRKDGNAIATEVSNDDKEKGGEDGTEQEEVQEHLKDDDDGFTCGAYFAVLPATPTVTPDQLWEACQQVSAAQQQGYRQVEWRFRRTCSLNHPQLDRPLQYLEVSGMVPNEASCRDVVDALLLQDQVVGNAELVLCLEGTEIPLMPVELPMDGSLESLERYGVVGISHAVPTNNSNDDETGSDLLKHVLDHAVRRFETLYEKLASSSSSSQSSVRRYREIMQRDFNRFDFRLDLPVPREYDGSTNEGDDSAPCWKVLEERGSWMPLITSALGIDAVRVKCGCVVSLPGAHEQYWHSDGVHVGPALSLGRTNETVHPSHALCVFVPLLTLTNETGGTEFWAGSHKYDTLLSKKGEQALPGGTIGIVQQGDAIVYDYRVVHRGMANTSGIARPIAYYLYAKEGYESVEDQNFVQNSIWDE
jgi:Phytanoyl-CoA dioxygenase (PhyH)